MAQFKKNSMFFVPFMAHKGIKRKNAITITYRLIILSKPVLHKYPHIHGGNYMDYYDTENDSPDLAEIIMSRISSQLSTHNWSLKILSDNSGVPYETIKKIANGKISNPSLKSILKISLAFGCTIDYLAGKEISPRPSDHS